MAEIVGIHGIYWNWLSRTKMETTWLEAIRTGLINRRCTRAADVTFAAGYYGDYYNDGKASGEPSAELMPGMETDMLLAMAEAVAPGFAEAEPEPSKFGMPSIVQAALRVLVNSTFAGQATEAMIVGFVRQVRRYFEDLDLREKIQAEIRAAVNDDTRLFVAHSLGTVVAYEALRRNPDWPIETLITIGSPLGLPAIQQRLWAQAGLENAWAGQVKTWINIAARQDAVAMVKELAPIFHPDIRDLSCDNPFLQAHHATWYLQNAKLAKALCNALG